MPWPFQHGRLVTVTRYTFNPRTQERSTPETHTLESCAFAPSSGVSGSAGTSEADGVGDSVTSKAVVYGPYDADVLSTDTVTVAGVDGVWEADGEPMRWRNDLTGTEALSEIHLTRKAGAL